MNRDNNQKEGLEAWNEDNGEDRGDMWENGNGEMKANLSLLTCQVPLSSDLPRLDNCIQLHTIAWLICVDTMPYVMPVLDM